MDEVTLYSYKYIGGGQKEQVFITINCKEKSYKTNINQEKYKHSKFGFSCYELKDYSEFLDLERCLRKKRFKQKELEE